MDRRGPIEKAFDGNTCPSCTVLRAENDALHKAYTIQRKRAEKVEACCTAKDVRIKELEEEKDRRIYYQNVVYAVCDKLDRIVGNPPGTGIVCGTKDSPTTEVQGALAEIDARLSISERERDEARAQVCRAREALEMCLVLTEAYNIHDYAREALNKLSAPGPHEAEAMRQKLRGASAAMHGGRR